jgi:inhibitor of cysteine peptidase
VKRISGNYKKVAILILAFLFTFPSIGLALSKNETSRLPMQVNIPCDKIWTLVFNEKVRGETITKDNILIRDSKGFVINIKLELSEDEKSVKLIPSMKYSVGEKYTIHVKNLITNKTGNKILKNDLEMDFTVSSKITDLPVVGTETKLRELLGSIGYNNYKYMEKANMEESLEDNSSADLNYSNTNIQVKGVDEGDNVKTDGKNIYRINKENVEIIKAYPVGEMKILKTIEFNKNESVFYPKEIYVDAKHLVVIGSCNYRESIQKLKDTGVKASETQELIDIKEGARILSPFSWKNTLRVLVYDISDINNIKQTRKVEVDGHTLATRKIGNMLHLVSNEGLNYYSENISNITPGYIDSAIGEEYVKINYKDIHYLKDNIKANYLMLTNINLENTKEPASIYTCLGGGDDIYMSKENLFISVQDSNGNANYEFMNQITEKRIIKDKTNIYKFQLRDGKFEYVATGQIKGTVLNQFSMDENNNYLRIATTTNSIWNENGQESSKNNIYILDNELNIAGKLEGMAIGERIYSVRFMGDKGYVVTYKNIDPLFVIDLKNVNNPTILGELKIPGFSSYLQPYDENHIIGIGKDTEEVEGRVTEKGVKLSLFDVTDYKNPKEQFNTVIGDAGTYSEVLNNHKALLFSRDKNILAFPISVVKNTENSDNKLTYGKQVFQGAYVYNIDLANGFKLRGTITHLYPVEFNIDSYEGNYDRNIQRILYINDTLYTISNDVIMASDFNNLSVKNKIIEAK